MNEETNVELHDGLEGGQLFFKIDRLEHQSRLELLARTIFGPIYIVLPHLFVLFFVSIWGSILSFIGFLSVLFTGRYPESYYEFQVGLMRWNARLNASLFDLVDGYPAFGVNASHPQVHFEVKYPERLSRGHLLLKLFFAPIYVALPHGFLLMFVSIGALIVNFIAFWAILFIGKYPQGLFEYMEGFLRWNIRVNLYLSFMSDIYPPFSLK